MKLILGYFKVEFSAALFNYHTCQPPILKIRASAVRPRWRVLEKRAGASSARPWTSNAVPTPRKGAAVFIGHLFKPTSVARHAASAFEFDFGGDRGLGIAIGHAVAAAGDGVFARFAAYERWIFVPARNEWCGLPGLFGMAAAILVTILGATKSGNT